MCVFVIQFGIVILLSYATKELDKMTLAKTYYRNLKNTEVGSLSRINDSSREIIASAYNGDSSNADYES